VLRDNIHMFGLGGLRNPRIASSVLDRILPALC
jgi:hypothetical protein